MEGVGIVSYGTFVPLYRIKSSEIVEQWMNTLPVVVEGALNVHERTVMGFDDDVVTMAVAASKEALARIGKNEVDALLLGSCTHTDDSKGCAATVARILDEPASTLSTDVKFSEKSGTDAMILALALVRSGMKERVLAIGSDSISYHTAPGATTEAYAGAGAGAVVIGSENVIAQITDEASYTTELADSFRFMGDRYIKIGMCNGSSKNSIGVKKHTIAAVRALFEKTDTQAHDYTYAVFSQATGSISFSLAEALGFTREQVAGSVVADQLGDTGSASAMLGLAKVLDIAKPGDTILLASYGFGAGSDAMRLVVTDEILRVQDEHASVATKLSRKKYVNYATAMKYEFKYLNNEDLGTAIV